MTGPERSRTFLSSVLQSWAGRVGIGVLGLLVGLFTGWLLWEQDRWTPPEPIPIDLGPGRYVALGDSYAAGEGLDPWEEGTEDAPSGNRCHRSATQAYSRRLVFVDESEITRVFRACSGAVVANAYDVPQVHKDVSDPQTVQVTPDIERTDVRLVTLSMGGNDAGFSRVLKRCFLDRCLTQPYTDLDGHEYTSLDEWAEDRLPVIHDHLVELYKQLRVSFPEARILVLGYPSLLPLVEPPFGRDPGRVCHTLFGDGVPGGWEADERAAVQDWGSQLNIQINKAVEESQSDIEYVDLQSHFAGHEACGPNGAWLRSVTLPPSGPTIDGILHPRKVGQAMMARIVSCHLFVFKSAEEARAVDEGSGFAMAGCVNSQSLGLPGMIPSGVLPGDGEAVP